MTTGIADGTARAPQQQDDAPGAGGVRTDGERASYAVRAEPRRASRLAMTAATAGVGLVTGALVLALIELL